MIYGMFSYVTLFGLIYWVMKYDIWGAVGISFIWAIAWWLSGMLVTIFNVIKSKIDKTLIKIDYYFYKKGLDE